MGRTKEPYTVPSKKSADPARHKAPWCCKWWETTTNQTGTREIRKTKWFSTKKEALEWGQERAAQRICSDIRPLTDSERAKYLHYSTECASRGLSMDEVFGAGIMHLGAEKISTTQLDHALELFAIWMESEHYSQKTIRGLEGSINWLIRKTSPTRPMASFSASELNTLVKARYSNHTSRSSFLRDLRSFFSWAAQHNHCSAKVPEAMRLDDIQRKSSARKSAHRRTHKRPPRLTVEQIQTLFKKTDARLHPLFALGTFAGLRPETELMSVEWEMRENGQLYGIDFEQRTIHLHESWVSKTFMERTLTDLPAPLWTILERHRGSGRISPMNYRNWRNDGLTQAKMALGFDRWPADIMRHTAASFQYILIGKSLAMKNLGHKNASTFDTHYLNAVSGSEARALESLQL
jgi:hypothetical protein